MEVPRRGVYCGLAGEAIEVTPASARRAWQITATVVVLGCAGASLAGKDERPGGTVVVAVRPGSNAAPWIADALEENIKRDVAGYQRILVLDERDLAPLSCGTDTDCLVAGYAARGADIVLLGVVQGPALNYALYETWTPARVAYGSLDIGPGTGLISLKQQTLRAFRPFLSQGGLLDQKPYLTSTREPPVLAADGGHAARRSRPLLVAIVLGAVAFVLALPIGIGALAMRRQRVARLSRLPAVWLSGLLIVALMILAMVASLSSRPVPALLPARWQSLAGIACGLAWGVFLVDSVRFAFPPLHGLERVGHLDMFRLIREWFFACVQRAALLVAYYAPFGVALAWACDAFDIPSREAIIVLAPATGLLARFWIASWVQCMTPYVDDQLVTGDASRDNPWHSEIHRYFMGYVRRTGWDIDPHLLSRVLFLPGSNDGVVSYGGAGRPNRIVVDERLLQLAMGSLEQAPPEESDVPWPQWPAGFLVATPAIESVKRMRHGAAAGLHRAATSPSLILQRVRSRTHSDQRKLVGQAATMLAYVVPAAPGELVPLIADDLDDLDVVRELLSEHYAWYAADPDDEDDDTDPTDKDLLFGALARELGAIERRDHQRATLAIACHVNARDGGRAVRAALSAVGEFFRSVSSRYPAIVADAYVALQFGRHQLVQYLYYRETGKTSLLTSRASPARLHSTSIEILAAVDGWPTKGREHLAMRASHRNRLVWLSRFFPVPIAEPRAARARKLIAAGIATAVIVTLGFAVKRAIDYGPTYVERIAEQERELRESQQKIAQPETHLEQQDTTDHGETQKTD